MKVYVNRAPMVGVAWGGGKHYFNAFHKYLPKVGSKLELDQNPALTQNPDLIYALGVDEFNGHLSFEQLVFYKEFYNQNVKLVLRVNENDARKGTKNMDKFLIKLSKSLDGTVFVGKWLQEYFNDKGWQCKNQTVIHNGVNRERFAPQEKLNNGKINVVTHHWSNNDLKGFDIYEKLDKLVGEFPDKLAFTYIGREQGSFKHTTVVKPLDGTPLGQELGKHDVYVSASRFDPFPNHVLEALSCCLPTFIHKDGGGCVEAAGESAVFNDFNDLKGRLLDRKWPNNFDGAKLRGWEECIKETAAYLESV